MEINKKEMLNICLVFSTAVLLLKEKGVGLLDEQIELWDKCQKELVK